MTADYLNAAPRDGIVRLTTDEVPTLVVRVHDYPMSGMGTLFDSVFSTIFAAMSQLGLAPVGAPFSLHTRMPTDTSDFEVGFPVNGPASAISVNGVDFIPSELPAGDIATTSCLGAYEGLADAWGEFMGGVVALDAQPDFPFWEVYVTQPAPDADPANLRTDLYTALRQTPDQ